MTNSGPDRLPAIETQRPFYVLKWYEGDSPRFCFFVRGIQPDCTFYGELTTYLGNSGKKVRFKGALAPADYERLLSLIGDIKACGVEHNSVVSWKGLLAEGPIYNPQWVFRYQPAALATTVAGDRFAEIIEVMRPYLIRYVDA
jgi:hypothetical protein